MQKTADLHTHTTASDGTLSPKELIELCKKENISAVAICDHDTAAGAAEAIKCAKDCGVEIIGGIEISCKFSGEFHMLGLFVDVFDQSFLKACRQLEEFRMRRNMKMIENIKNNTTVTADDILNASAKRDISHIGRPHMACALVDKGYANSITEAFEKYLSRGKMFYEEREKFSIKESIDIIHKAGGLAVAAHLNHSVKNFADLDALLKILKGYGIDGAEAYHSSMPDYYTKYMLELCEKYDLGISAGSDFHGKLKDAVQLGKTYGEKPISYDIVRKLKSRMKK